jgi:hypothetical protein
VREVHDEVDEQNGVRDVEKGLEASQLPAPCNDVRVFLSHLLCSPFGLDLLFRVARLALYPNDVKSLLPVAERALIAQLCGPSIRVEPFDLGRALGDPDWNDDLQDLLEDLRILNLLGTSAIASATSDMIRLPTTAVGLAYA